MNNVEKRLCVANSIINITRETKKRPATITLAIEGDFPLDKLIHQILTRRLSDIKITGLSLVWFDEEE